MYCCDGWMCGCGGQWLPEDPCGICGEETPLGSKHCSAKCAAKSAELLEKAKAGARG